MHMLDPLRGSVVRNRRVGITIPKKHVYSYKHGEAPASDKVESSRLSQDAAHRIVVPAGCMRDDTAKNVWRSTTRAHLPAVEGSPFLERSSMLPVPYSSGHSTCVAMQRCTRALTIAPASAVAVAKGHNDRSSLLLSSTAVHSNPGIT